jgi:hypothetical protein
VTTPYQAAPDGAVTVGGGAWNYGQTLDESIARAAFEFPMPTPGNMLDLLRIALESLPIDALKPFANFLGLVDGVFDNLAEAVNQILGSLVTRVFQTVADFGDFIIDLFNNPGLYIKNLFAVVMEGIYTIGDFLKKLWENFTGNFTTPGTKGVLDVVTAGGGIKTTLGTTTTTADGARDNLQVTLNELYDAFDGTTTPTGTVRTPAQTRGRGAVVRSSAKTGENYYYAGANMLINPGFEDTTFPILNQGVGVTADVGTGDLARTGTRSLKLVAAAGYPYSYLASSPTSQVYFPTSPTEKYTIECWVRGKATNTQVTAATGIALGITTYDTAKATPVNVAVSFPSGTDTINAAWVKLSATVEVPAGKAFFTPYIQLNSAVVTAGHSFYFDDAVVREVTDAKAASAAVVATNTALYGTSTPAATVAQDKITNLPTDLGYATNTATDASGTGVTNSSRLALLESEQSSAANSGNSGFDGFDYTTTTGLTPPGGTSSWALTSVGTGTGTVRADGTSMDWVAGTSATATVRARFVKATTVTSYQKVTAVIDGPIFNAVSSTASPTPMVALVCRLDSTWGSYVYARIVPTGSGNVQATLWKVSGGVETQITVAGAFIYSWKLKIGDTIQLIAGDTSALTFRLLLNGNEVASINDSASIGTFVSVENATTNNFTGLMLRNGGIYSPASLASFAMSDNKPPATVGSGIKINRTAATTGALSSGENVFPIGWFGNIVDKTDDLTYDTSGTSVGKVTVSVEGWYKCDICVATTGASAGGGVVYTILWTGSGAGARTVAAYGGQSRFNAAGGTGPVLNGSFQIYLKAGEYVEPGYYSNAAISAAMGSTDATFAAKTCWWKVSLMNRSYN